MMNQANPRHTIVFHGRPEVSVDAKGRMLVPIEMRESISRFEDEDMRNRLYLALVGGEGAEILPHAIGLSWSMYLNLGQDLDYCTEDRAALLEGILENTEMVKFDPQGRAGFSAHAQAHLQIKDKVIFSGRGRYFEVWAPELQEKMLPETRAYREEIRQIMRNVARIENGGQGK